MSRYRYGILELILDPHVIDKYAQEDLITYYHNMRTSERILLLREQLLEEMHIMIQGNLTQRQKQILELYLQGKKQQEIADTLNIVQSAVSLHLNGIPDYRRGRKVYGGIINKLKKLCRSNKRIQSILLEIRTHRDLS
jgi:DNA-binding CsgD family transcriptional regulator